MNIIYCRYSPRPDAAVERSCSLQVQTESCTKYCKMNGLAIDGVIEDPEVSARKTPLFERPGGRKLLMLPSNSNVIAMKLDRVFRSTVDGLTTLKHMQEAEVKFHLANEGGCSIDTSTATGELIATFLLGVASWEPRTIAERTSAGLQHRMKNQKAHLNPKNFPYGMMEDPDSRRHSASGHHEGMIECPEEREVIMQILQYWAFDISYNGIARRLKDDGILNRGDKPFHPQQIKRIIERETNASA